MRLSTSVTSRTLFLLVSLLCCARNIGARPTSGLPRRISRRKQYGDIVAGLGQGQVSAAGSDFTIQVSPPTLVISVFIPFGLPVGEADGTVTLTGMNGFADIVNLSCTIPDGPVGPDFPTCGFPGIDPTDQLFVDASGLAATTGLRANSVPATCSAPDEGSQSKSFNGDNRTLAGAGGGLFLVVLLSCSAGLLPTRRRAKLLPFAILCAAALAISGCRNGPSGGLGDGCQPPFGFIPGTPPGTYMIIVTATSGSVSHSTTVQLTVPAP